MSLVHENYSAALPKQVSLAYCAGQTWELFVLCLTSSGVADILITPTIRVLGGTPGIAFGECVQLAGPYFTPLGKPLSTASNRAQGQCKSVS